MEALDPYSFVMAEVTNVLMVSKHQESVIDTKPLKAKDYLSNRMKAIGSYFYRFPDSVSK